MEVTITADHSRFDVALIHRFLSEESHWARGIPRAIVERALAHSICFGAFSSSDGDRGATRSEQIGFARVVTDRATFAFLCDVFVVEAWRGRGVARRLLDAVFAHPALQGLRRFALTSRTAPGLYASYGFAPLGSPEVWMERHNPHIYSQTGSES